MAHYHFYSLIFHPRGLPTIDGSTSALQFRIKNRTDANRAAGAGQQAAGIPSKRVCLILELYAHCCRML